MRKPAAIFVLFFLILFAVAGAGCSDGAKAKGKKKSRRNKENRGPETVLLLTNPTTNVLSNIVYLVRHDILSVPNLKIIGIFARDEEGAYHKSKLLLKEKRYNKIHVREVNCAVRAGEVFAANECTPYFEKLLKKADGIVFSGGPDIPPVVYGDPTRLTTVIKKPRQQFFEISLLFHLLGKEGKPPFVPVFAKRPHFMILGICHGMQALNVALGGTLFQDIPSDLYSAKTYEGALKLPPDNLHQNLKKKLDPIGNTRPWVVHAVQLKDGFVPGGIAPDSGTVKVMSNHHQAVKKIGRNLEVTGFSKDGKIPEALKYKKYPNVFGVQFHPEYQALYRSADKGGDTKKKTEPHKDKFDNEMLEFHLGFWKEAGAMLQKSADERR